jgi:hypothetical protein
MDNARQILGQSFKSVRHHLWRQDALMNNKKFHLHKLSDTLKLASLPVASGGDFHIPSG